MLPLFPLLYLIAIPNEKAIPKINSEWLIIFKD